MKNIMINPVSPDIKSMVHFQVVSSYNQDKIVYLICVFPNQATILTNYSGKHITKYAVTFFFLRIFPV